MIVSSAPGRCGIIGNPTDMYGGSVISCSTVERAHCRLVESSELIVSVSGASETIRACADFRLKGDSLDIPKAILSYLGIDPSCFRYHLTASTDIPERAGLAGSTAMVVAILGAVLQKTGAGMDSYRIAEAARKIEYGTMGIICGFQDQHMAAFGGLNFMDFRGKESLEQRDDEPLATVEPLHDFLGEVPIVVAHTGIKRNSGIVHRSIRDRWLEGERAVVEGYERIAELARLAKKSLLDSDWQTLGEMMNENHAIQQSLGGSGPQNDHLISVARQNAALGAKLSGAGHGGTIIALTLEPDRTAAALIDAGADRILWPAPAEGLRVEHAYARTQSPEPPAQRDSQGVTLHIQ